MWLLLQSIFNDLQQARASGVKFSAEQIAQFEAQFSAADTSRVMALAGGNAQIHVKGVLTNSPDMWAQWFGGGNTTYPEIIAALAEADANPEVDEIIMKFDSGGGAISGMFDAMEAIKNTKKPVKAIVNTMAASAAYGLASQADTIEAHNRASQVGSVGIVVEAFVSDNIVTITSTEAPKKRPDLTTEEGKAAVREELDAVHDLFAEHIADGRGTDVDTVNADFGQGAMLLADNAVKRGMIDGIAKVGLKSVKSTNSNAATGGGQQEAIEMDLNKLKADHPDVYAAAVKIGADAERDRVGAHVTMGTASGDMKTALSAIEDGSAMTATLQAKYLAAGMNRTDVEARGQDNPAEVGAGEEVTGDDEDADAKAGASILAAAAAKCGVELAAEA